jgi:hypothetical protein
LPHVVIGQMPQAGRGPVYVGLANIVGDAYEPQDVLAVDYLVEVGVAAFLGHPSLEVGPISGVAGRPPKSRQTRVAVCPRSTSTSESFSLLW